MEKNGILLWRDLFEIAGKVCLHFGLKYGRLEPETEKRAHCYGRVTICNRCHNTPGVTARNCNDKIIKIRIHHLRNREKPLLRKTIFDTFAHEFAHLRPSCWDHSKKHRAFCREILAFIKELGYPVE